MIVELEPSFSVANKTKQLQGWTFHYTMTITGQRGEKAIDIVNQEKFESLGGLYAVYHDEELVYIGEYSNSFQSRWVNKRSNSNCERTFRHFKGDKLAEQARKTNKHVHVYVLPLSSIREKFPDNRWVNQHGVEAELIRHYNPPMNKQHKVKKKAI
jgi:hypothetical protein